MDLRPRELLREARRRGLLPKKALGQHFLVEEGIAERIVELSQVDQRDVILEIGPGIGALTFVLLERSRKVVAVEIDPRFIPFLREMAGDDDRLELLEGDIMEVDLGGIALRKGRLKVVSNLPYNLSVPILFRLLEEREHLKGMTLMVQREVAERITSPPGRKSYGALSVLCQLWADPKVVMYVPPGAFWPPPEVEGAVVRFELFEGSRVPVKDLSFFRRVVQACFLHRRKTLLNSLSSAGYGPKERLKEALEGCGIDPRRRGETLSLEALGKLEEALSCTVQEEVSHGLSL